MKTSQTRILKIQVNHLHLTAHTNDRKKRSKKSPEKGRPKGPERLWAKAPPDEDQWRQFYQRFIDLIFDHQHEKNKVGTLARLLIRQIDSFFKEQKPDLSWI